MGDSKIIELFDKLAKEIAELTKQVGINCNKLDKMKKNTDLIPQIFEIVTANGQGLEVLSDRIVRDRKII